MFSIHLIFMVLIVQQKLTCGMEKIWKPNNDIFDPSNWLSKEPEQNCEGVFFSQINTAPIFVEKLKSKQFVLPYNGEIVLTDGGYLEVLDADSKEKATCLKLKELNYHRFLYPENWLFNGNEAVPDLERTPCVYDTVEFPHGVNSAVETSFAIRSRTVSGINIAFGHHTNYTFGQTEFLRFQHSDIGRSVFYDDIRIHSLSVEYQPYDTFKGTVCQKKPTLICKTKRNKACSNPVRPNGFCNQICGAYITLRDDTGFRMDKLKMELNEFTNVDTHMSRTRPGVVQIVFAEKQFTGASIIAAKKYHEKLRSDLEQYRIRTVKLQFSGHAIQATAATAVSIVFGTLLGVCLLFGAIFYFHNSTTSKTSFTKRFSLSFRPLSTDFMARFNNREDGSGLIFEGQSLAGSIMSLDKAFDNPMYGKVPPNAGEAAVKFKKADSEEGYSADTTLLSDIAATQEELLHIRGSGEKKN